MKHIFDDLIREAELRILAEHGLHVELHPEIKRDCLTLEEVVEIVCEAWGRTTDEFWHLAKKGKRTIVGCQMRQMVIALAYPNICKSLQAMAIRMHRINHTTVIHAKNQHQADHACISKYREIFDMVEIRVIEMRQRKMAIIQKKNLLPVLHVNNLSHNIASWTQQH